MDFFQIESSGVWLAAAIVFFAIPILVIYLRRLRRKHRSIADMRPGNAVRQDDWVSAEIKRLCSGAASNETFIRRMSSEERALFEVGLIDALNGRTREEQHRLRSVLIKNGYDELCSRRVMSENLSDRIRAMALLKLLRPQWRDTAADNDLGEAVEEQRRARGAIRSTGPLDAD
ncbi:MAG TPA: hypothetical protein VKN18_16350 [Blastocatellia bacterium]|nr:hypothetical protein [Blastocatellia bacterium]